MNARGLMELIILNIGLQRGVITPTLFTIMVLMAVVTTLMASPLFELVYGRRTAAAAQEQTA
jgi:Kef-type K+ transport system membrane component KefB